MPAKASFKINQSTVYKLWLFKHDLWISNHMEKKHPCFFCVFYFEPLIAVLKALWTTDIYKVLKVMTTCRIFHLLGYQIHVEFFFFVFALRLFIFAAWIRLCLLVFLWFPAVVGCFLFFYHRGAKGSNTSQPFHIGFWLVPCVQKT